jgi:Zn-dependent protease
MYRTKKDAGDLMDWAATIGTIRGVKIRIHATFVVVILWAIYNWGINSRWGTSGALFGVLLIALLFVSVVLHELAHSFVAMLYGVQVREIELSPIGGMSKMESVPAKPYQEFIMAVAGPLINLALAIPLGLAVLWMAQAGFVRSMRHLAYLMVRPSWQGLVLNALASNVALALFNLLPAFPMDGGRMMRSALAWGIGQWKATRWAARIGQGLAVMMAVAGLLTGNLILVLIAVVVFVGAHQEAHFTDLQFVLGDMEVGQALFRPCLTLSADDTLQAVIDSAMHGHAAPFAVVEAERLVGWLSRLDVHSALATYGSEVRVGDIMRKEFSSLSPIDSLIRARQMMAMEGVRALPVVDADRLLGMVTAAQIQEIYTLLSARQRRRKG